MFRRKPGPRVLSSVDADVYINASGDCCVRLTMGTPDGKDEFVLPGQTFVELYSKLAVISDFLKENGCGRGCEGTHETPSTENRTEG